ncbi:hypothetical protein PEC302110_13310 [Pectobacterium araliae]|uniref:Uncharacterized protein n=1 Tax=Pectobacterium araliae TaxID=3073862 RepID=A0AAN0KFM7_9GAMM|nr:hypothetical protein PEC302110_13310 [Pectobacterium sp. MAFF 302110]
MQSAPGSQDDDGDPLELVTQTRHQAHAITVGQAEVEQDKFWHADIELMQSIHFSANPYDI